MSEAVACQEDPEMWFDSHPRAQALAKKLCFECPRQATCLQNALDFEELSGGAHRYGIFGGLTPAERLNLTLKRRNT